VLTLEEAVRKMTSVPAERFKLGKRGLLARGWVADIAAFDPDTVLDLADYDHPNTLARGIRHVLVNGTRVIEDGIHLGARPGRALRRES
jgi:N-acyl-D-amino-acid deacylase